MSRDYELFESSVVSKTSQRKFDGWINGIGEDSTDWFRRWMKRLSGLGNRLAVGSLVAEIAVDAVESFAAGFVQGADEVREALDDVEI